MFVHNELENNNIVENVNLLSTGYQLCSTKIKRFDMQSCESKK